MVCWGGRFGWYAVGPVIYGRLDGPDMVGVVVGGCGRNMVGAVVGGCGHDMVG